LGPSRPVEGPPALQGKAAAGDGLSVLSWFPGLAARARLTYDWIEFLARKIENESHFDLTPFSIHN
jgi:hypothetical protein